MGLGEIAALITAVGGIFLGAWRLRRIDKAVNDRPKTDPTVSDDVTEIKQEIRRVSDRQTASIAWQRDHSTHHAEMEKRQSRSEQRLDDLERQPGAV